MDRGQDLGWEWGIFGQAKEKHVNDAIGTSGLEQGMEAADERIRGNLVPLARAKEKVFKSRKEQLG